MIQAPETFWTLFHDAAHWKFELFVGGIEELVTGVLVGMVLWPKIKKHWQHHLERDKKEAAKIRPNPARQSKDYPWSLETMRIINSLTTSIKDKAFEPEWFLLRQRLEQFEDSKRGSNGDGN